MLCLSLILSPSVLSSSFASIEQLPSINDIYQDNEGYIWIASQHGITRYDSVNKIDFSNHSELWPQPYRWVHQLSPFKGRLLVSTQLHGLYIFNTKNGVSDAVPLPASMSTIYFATYFRNKIYFKVNNELHAYDLTSKHTQLVGNNISIIDIVASDSTLYIIGKDHISMVSDNIVSSIYEGAVEAFTLSGNHLFFSDSDSISRITKAKIEISKPLKNTFKKLTGHFDKNSIFTLNKQGEINQYYTKNLIELEHSYPDIEPTNISEFFHDSSNVLWIASNKGIEMLNEVNYRNTPKIFDVDQNANEILFVDDELIIGTYGEGLHTMNGKSKFLHPNINDSLTENAKRSMALIRKDNKLLLGAFDGVWSYQFNAEVAQKLPFENNDNIVLKLIDYNGKLYIGTNDHGLKIYDWAQQKITAVVDKKYGLKNLEVIDILPINNGDIWLATANNVEIYNPRTQQVKQTGINIPNKVLSLTLLDDKVYAFTKGSGVLIFNTRGELLSQFGKGIDFSRHLNMDEEIWISAKPGLYRLNTENNQLTLVTGSEQYAFYGSPIKYNDSIYAWHLGGLIEIDYSENINFNAAIKISRANISGQVSLNRTDFELSSSNDIVTLELASLDYRSSNTKQFQYRINNSVWTNTSGNQITLTGLTSGDYDIEIKGTNSLGQWSHQRAFAKVSVAYPWYWTTQIRVVYAVTFTCFVLLVAWLIFLRANSINKIHLLLESELKNKGKKALSISRNLHLVNTLLERDNLEEAKQVIEQSIETLESNNAQKEPDSLFGNSLSVALPYLGEYLYQKYHIKVVSKIEVDESSLDYELQANIYKIIYESVTSAILNSESRVFEIHIQEFKSKLWLTINDDENSFAHFNNTITFDMAMYYVRKIAEKYNASVHTFDAQDDKGSQLVISFPLMKVT